MSGFNFSSPPASSSSTGNNTNAPATSSSAGGFSFLPPSTVTTTTPAATAPSTNNGIAAAGTGVGAAGGGFTFATTPSSNPISTPVTAASTAAPTAPATTAPATTAPTVANGGSGGFSFGSATPTAATPTPVTASTTPSVPPPSTFTAPTPTTAPPVAASTLNQQSQQVHATVPEYEKAFPFVVIHDRLETILKSITSDSGGNSYNSTTMFTQQQQQHDLALKGFELIQLLEDTFGNYLSKPQPLVLTSFTQNTSLRQAVQIGLSNNNKEQQLPHFMFPNQAQSTPIPFDFLQQIIQLSDSLDLSEELAASIYAEVAASSLNNKLDSNKIQCSTLRSFHKKQRIGMKDSFCNNVIHVAKRNGTYVTSSGSGDNVQGNSTTNMIATATQSDDNDNGIMKTAQELYFWERGHCLKTILMLIQYRVSACSTLSTTTNNNKPNEEEQQQQQEEHESISSKMILEATDQLLQNNLIVNLIQFIRDMTVKNEELAKKICTALDQAATTTPAITTPAPTTSFLGSSFGGTKASTTQPTSISTSTINIHDMDYALYEFTIHQRQIAAECLFYLTYHTQCNQNEITGLIDLIQDLTNGSNNNNNKGIGSGLPSLDPFKDVATWIEEGFDGQQQPQQQQQQQQVAQGFYPSSPFLSNLHTPTKQKQQQQQQKKHHCEWEEELVTSLWSVSGLTHRRHRHRHRVLETSSLHHHRTTTGTTSDVVGGGKPQLLKCVTTLMLSTVCSLDGKNILMDRDLHGPNSFGVGNALIPSPLVDVTVFQGNIEAINERLNPNLERFISWKRKDIAGFLSAAYALLLCPAASSLSSPRQRSNSLETDLKSTFRSCLEVPTVSKSLTFARLGMLPCIGMASMNSTSSLDLDSDFCFYISVLSEFTAQYLDAICLCDLPTSRAKWTHDEEQELQLRQVQEGEKKEVFAWSGQPYKAVQVPTEVDVSKRPDCLDDIIALAVDVCFVCPDCAMRFWSTYESPQSTNGNNDAITDDSVVHLKPSRIMRNLERVQANDLSLLPAYLSFLSTMALSGSPDDHTLSRNGATAVHDWLSNADRESFSPVSPSANIADVNRIDWAYILNTIRFYAHQLNPPQAGDGFCQSSSSYATNEDSTAYYYGATDNGAYSNIQAQQGAVKSSSVSSVEAKKKLDENSTLTLLSLLGLLSHVSLKSKLARKSILDTKLTVHGSKRFALEDDALSILFTLLVTSITPEIRGSTLMAIANLVRCDDISCLSVVEKEQVMDTAKRGWDLLETSQIIPIDILSQYSILQGVQSSSSSNKSDISGDFCWFPASDKYGIVNEMEHVESKQGCYPSTEGLLQLLTALISTVGCPSDVGSQWRSRPGCAPYIEYVVNFVLPRAMGTKSCGTSLHFATLADKARLVTRALEVVDAVVTRYIVPSPEPSTELSVKNNSIKESSSNCALSLIQTDILPPDETSPDKEAFLDFTNENVQTRPSTQIPMIDINEPSNAYLGEQPLVVPTNGFPSAAPSQALSEKAPRAKSPAFFVLADLLSTGGILFDILARILVEEKGPNGINTLYGDTFYSMSLALALFGDLPPDFSLMETTRDSKSEQQQMYTITHLSTPSKPSTKVKAMKLTLSPPSVQDLVDRPMKYSERQIASPSNAILWREHSILLALRILCAAAWREEKFSSLLDLSQTSVKLVPILRFQPRVQNRLMMPLDIKNIQVSSLTNQLLRQSRSLVSSSDGSLLRILPHYVGYQSASLTDEEDIAAMAVSLIAYFCATTTPGVYVQALAGLDTKGQAELASSLATRLSLRSKFNYYGEESITEVILNLLLNNLELESVGDENLSHIILGLSGESLNAQKNMLQKPPLQKIFVEYGEYHSALDAVLDLVSDINFVLSPLTSSLAAKCHEIIFRLCEAHDKLETSISPSWMSKTLVLSKLRSIGFWHTQLHRLLCDTTTSESILRRITSQSTLNMKIRYEDHAMVSRDSNVLHCISWILKGVAIELYTLMGFNCPGSLGQNFGGMLAAAAPQPSQCRQLLKVLIGRPQSLVSETLLDLPLVKPSIATGLGADSPPRDLLRSAANPLKGPMDVCFGYEVIDPIRLQRSIRITANTCNENLDERENAIAKWAQKWNDYVMFTCAASHLSNAWDTLLRTLLTYCEPLLFHDQSKIHFNNECVVDKSDILCLLKSLLFRLSGQHRQHNSEAGSNYVPSTNFIHQNVGKQDEIEPSTALPLSIACLSLVQKIFHNKSNISFPVESGDLLQILSLLAISIGCCEVNNSGEEGCHDERAAVLSCALTNVLDSKVMREATFLFNALLSFESQALQAGSYLSKLLAFYSHRSSTVEDTKKHAIALAARSGLRSLIEFFDIRHDRSEERDHFLLELFAPGVRKGKTYLLQFIQLLVGLDADIVILLERIACCCHGTELLVEAGVTSALISASTSLSQNTEFSFHNDAAGSETYGSIQVEPPRQVAGHFHLLNSLLSSTSSSHVRQQLLCDAVKFIEQNAVLGERLLKSYPKYDQLTMQFIKCMYLLTSSLNRVVDSSLEGINASPNLKDVFQRDIFSVLQRRISDLAFHIGQYPFPSKHLARLPNELQEAQKIRMSRLKHLDVRLRDQCWWDSITLHVAATIMLPDPPFGSSDANFLKAKSDKKLESNWSDEKYRIALSGAQCLDLCLLFLSSHAIVVTDTLYSDGLALAQALCRMSDAINAIGIRLKKVFTPEETGLQIMMDLTNIIETGDERFFRCKEVIAVEQNALLSLGPQMALCVEKLLCLTLTQARIFAMEAKSGTLDSARMFYLNEFASVLIAALNYTDIESKGISCINMGENDVTSVSVKQAAKNLRNSLIALK